MVSENSIFFVWYLIVGFLFAIAIVRRRNHSLIGYMIRVAGVTIGWLVFVSVLMFLSIFAGLGRS